MDGKAKIVSYSVAEKRQDHEVGTTTNEFQEFEFPLFIWHWFYPVVKHFNGILFCTFEFCQKCNSLFKYQL